MDNQEISKVRHISLDTVLENSGAERDPQDPTNNWKTAAGRITVNGEKYYNHDAQQGGGGAIDLAMHVGGFKFKEAVAWLGGNMGKDLAISQYQHESKKHAEKILESTPVPKLAPPAPDQNKSERVRLYLTEKRGIPDAIVQNAMNKGRVYADKYGNAVFVLHDAEGKRVGAELRGTYDKPFHGVRGDKGVFVTGNKDSKVAVFVESGIDALSYQATNKNALVVSTTGSSKEVMSKTAQLLASKGFKIVAGFDNDRAGDLQAQKLSAALGHDVERQRPTAKDWNEEIRKTKPIASELSR